MIQFGRIELATYPNKPLDSMDFNEKKLLTRVRLGRTDLRNHQKFYEKKNLKIQNLFV